MDIIEKPTGKEPEGEWEERVLSTLRIVSKIRVITHVRGKLTHRALSDSVPAPSVKDVRVDALDKRSVRRGAPSVAKVDVVAIGAGGAATIVKKLNTSDHSPMPPALLPAAAAEPGVLGTAQDRAA